MIPISGHTLASVAAVLAACGSAMILAPWQPVAGVVLVAAAALLALRAWAES